MKIKLELILRILSAFEKNNYAQFIYENLNSISKNEFFKTGIKDLENLNLIKDETKNGYAKKIHMFRTEPCPSFLWIKDIPINLKEYLLQLYIENITKGKYISTDGRKDVKLVGLGYNREDILNNIVFIKKQIESNAELREDENGYKLINRTIKLDPRCKYCGETDPTKFSGGNKTTCRECQKKINRSQITLEENLYKRSKNNATNLKLEYDLDKAFIKELLESQKYKCKYSGIKFENNFHNKLTYPTIDRIDSKKGYTKDNVCVCTLMINIMKNTLNVVEFKDLISKVYNNINNF